MPISPDISDNASNKDAPRNEPRSLTVDLGARAYDIVIGTGLLDRITDFVPCNLKGRTLFVLTDENVTNHAGGQVFNALNAAGAESVQLLALPAGEGTKSVAFYERTMGWLLNHGVNRESILFAVGGGVIGDLAGFAAATVMRGIDFVQVPTSLLAQVDSSVGGKTGINMPQGKNLVGAFHQPISVVCDLEVFKTLPRREMLAGYAEIAKYGLLGDAEFFGWLEDNGSKVCDADPESCAYAVEMSCRKKAVIVAADEKEQGARALLNLGHTFGHAIEAEAGYDGRILHGEAVAIGMVLAFRLSTKMELCSAADAARVEAHLADIGLPTDIHMVSPPLDVGADALIAHMKKDKKIRDGKNIFILARGIGAAFVTKDVKTEDVKAVITKSLQA